MRLISIPSHIQSINDPHPLQLSMIQLRVALIAATFNIRILRVQDAPKLRVAIVGGGLAGLSTAVELLDQGHQVCPKVH